MTMFVARVLSFLLFSVCMADKSNLSKDKRIEYSVQHSLRITPVEKALHQETSSHQWARMLAAPEVLQLNSNLIKLIKGTRVLDIGTFTGASALSAALAVGQDGEVHTMDINEEYVNIGRPYFAAANVSEKIVTHIAPALDTLDNFIRQGESGKFDFAFIDADKNNYSNYYERCLELVRPGGIIAVDNTLYFGQVLNSTYTDSYTEGIREFNSLVKEDQRVDISFLTTGDGLTLLFVK